MLEGRIAIVLDRTPLVILVPALLIQFFQAPEDYYDRFQIGTYIRILRAIFGRCNLWRLWDYTRLAVNNNPPLQVGKLWYPILCPVSPTRFKDLKDLYVRVPIWAMKERPDSIPVKNKKRVVNVREQKDEK